jgi:hypothetical protein
MRESIFVLTFALLCNLLCHYKGRVFGRKIIFYGGLGSKNKLQEIKEKHKHRYK